MPSKPFLQNSWVIIAHVIAAFAHVIAAFAHVIAAFAHAFAAFSHCQECCTILQNTVKPEHGVIQFYFRKIPLHQQKFWWLWFFLIRCG